MVLGGNNGEFLDSVEAVSLSGEALDCPKLAPLPIAVDGVTSTNLGPNDAPVLCGGLAEGGEHKNECFVFKPYTNSWEFLAIMMETRTEYGVVQIDENRFWVTGN